MTASTLLAELRSDGVTVRAVGGALRLLARPGALTAADRQRVAANKIAILAALAAELESDRADVLAWGECYAWPSVHVDELVIEHGRDAWLTWTAAASALDLERVRMSACYWQDGERDEWLASKEEQTE